MSRIKTVLETNAVPQDDSAEAKLLAVAHAAFFLGQQVRATKDPEKVTIAILDATEPGESVVHVEVAW